MRGRVRARERERELGVWVGFWVSEELEGDTMHSVFRSLKSEMR